MIGTRIRFAGAAIFLALFATPTPAPQVPNLMDAGLTKLSRDARLITVEINQLNTKLMALETRVAALEH